MSGKHEVGGHDTLAMIHAKQAEQERQLKLANRIKAGQLLTRYAADKGWDDADVAEVKGALGL